MKSKLKTSISIYLVQLLLFFMDKQRDINGLESYISEKCTAVRRNMR